MSAVKHRCHGLTGIAQIAGLSAVPIAKYFVVVGSALAILLLTAWLVFAGAAGEFP
jgi:hypothetical protein